MLQHLGSAVLAHVGEEHSNQLRRKLADVEPLCLRTRTSSLAVIERSAGSYHWTSDGRKLADFTSGVLVANLGHNPAEWWEKLNHYLGINDSQPGMSPIPNLPQGFISAVPLTTYNAMTRIEVEATERLLASLRAEPGGGRMEQVLWAASGSEAVQKALWCCLARQHGSDIILATRGGFHGKKGLSGAVTGSEEDPERDPRVCFISFPRDECRSVVRRRQAIDLSPYQAELSALAREYGNRLCCLITEPYLGGGGSYHPQPEYLQLLERFCRENDIPFVLDEIQSNFGRTGTMYAFSHYGVEPDIVLLGKGLGNGIPVDAAAGREGLFRTLGYGEGSDTWSGHPLGCAAVLATLDEFEARSVVERSRILETTLLEGLERLTALPAVRAVRGEGTVWGIEFDAVGGHSPEDIALQAVVACYRGDSEGRAIHLLGPLAGRVVRVAPPLVMPPNEAKEYLTAMYEILAQLPLSSTPATDAQHDQLQIE